MDVHDFGMTDMFGEFPETVQRFLGLDSLERIVAAAGAHGATRLFTCPSFEPIEALTLLFVDDGVLASRVLSADDVWDRIACGGEPLSESPAPQPSRALHAPDLPDVLRDWKRVSDAIHDAESCMSDHPDGIPYFHVAFGGGVDSLQAWFNPTESTNPLQCAILGGYAQIRDSL